MNVAYDTYLQTWVRADLVERTYAFEPYRYECAFCGEEVRLAAIDSAYQVSHFRHLSGNSGVECEFYLGQYGTISTDARSRKSRNERADFYFDIDTKMFYLGLRFSEDEISAHEQALTVFELRTTSQAEPFSRVRINQRNFEPDIPRMVPLEVFSFIYYLSLTSSNLRRKHEVFKNIAANIPTFFKIQSGDNEKIAKLVRSDMLYTKTLYLMVYQSQYATPVDISLPCGVTVEKTFKFETMGRKCLGKIIRIDLKTEEIDSQLLSWGYRLEQSETLTLLWPPSTLCNDFTLIDSDEAYFYSTFELQAHGNINVHQRAISKVSDKITKVTIKPGTKIYKKNTELLLSKNEHKAGEYNLISVERVEADSYRAYDNNAYLFNQSGVSHLYEGMLKKYKQELGFRSFSRYFNLSGATSEDAPILAFCNWVGEQEKGRKNIYFQSNVIELYTDESFNFDMLHLRISDAHGNNIEYKNDELTIAYISPNGIESPNISFQEIGEWQIQINYKGEKHTETVLIKQLMPPRIDFTADLHFGQGNTVNLRNLIIRAIDGHGVNKKDDVEISSVGQGIIVKDIFTTDNTIGSYQIAYSFTDVTGAPYSTTKEIKIIDKSNPLLAENRTAPLLSFHGTCASIHISEIVDRLVTEINSLDFEANICVISTSLRSLIELSFDELHTREKFIFTEKRKLNKCIDEFKSFLLEDKLVYLCTQYSTVLPSFTSEKNCIEQIDSKFLASYLNLASHKSISRIDVTKIAETARKAIAPILVYISLLLK